MVQGVGFRPFVYRLARERGLGGFVRNSASGVEIEVEGEGVEAFLEEVRIQAPPLSEISALRAEEISQEGEDGFCLGVS